MNSASSTRNCTTGSLLNSGNAPCRRCACLAIRSAAVLFSNGSKGAERVGADSPPGRVHNTLPLGVLDDLGLVERVEVVEVLRLQLRRDDGAEHDLVAEAEVVVAQLLS